MNNEFLTALQLMAVGMITVFLILFSVVFFGKLLISTVNRFFAEPPQAEAPSSTLPPKEISIAPRKLAAIVAAVSIATQGQGQIKEIEKVR